MLQDYNVVKAVRVIENVPIGTMGTILLTYPSTPMHYEVEFMSSQGDTIAVLTVSEEDIEFYKEG